MSFLRYALFIVLLVNSTAYAQSISKDETEFIDRLMVDQYKPVDPGAVILVAKHGKPVFRKAYGMADLQLGVENSPEYVFRIGSMSKQFTAVCMLQLVQQGKLSLDDDIKEHLPWYNTHDKKITIRNLLTHTSGITSYTAKSDFGKRAITDTSKRELAEYFMDDSLLFEPGSDWSYSNSGYAVANLIIEEVSGLSFGDYLQKNVFDPLEMSKTYIGRNELIIPQAVSGYSPGEDGGFKNAAYLNWAWPYGGGQILSCVDDLLKWDEALYSATILDRKVLELAWQSGVIPEDRETNYGLGWGLREHEGIKIVQHGGGINGFRSFGVRIPSSHLYTVILSNNTGESPSIAKDIALKLAGKPLTKPSFVDAQETELEVFVGHYKMHRLGSRIAKQFFEEDVYRHVTMSDGVLFAQSPRGPKQVLNKVNRDCFFIKESKTFVRFERDENQNVTSLATFHQPKSGVLTKEPKTDFEIIIKGGTLIDGTGAPAKIVSIAIDDGKISKVGLPDSATAITSIDATGMVVSPGFIDAHNHSEMAIAQPERRFNEAFLRQGVTTIVGGPDGSLDPEKIRELIEAYEKNGIGTNVAFYIGHNAIRKAVVRKDPRGAPSVDELEEMKSLVDEGMALGAVGLSTGLMYPPGMFSKTDEVVALAKIVTKYNGIYDSHVRNPVHELVKSDEEVIEISRRAGIGGKIGHLKAVGLQNAGLINQVIALVNQARADGVPIVSDQYPYDGAATARLRDIIVVPSSLDQKDFVLREALADTNIRTQLRQASENGVDGGFAWLKATGYTSMRIVQCSDFPELVGKYLSELAEEESVEPFDKVAQLLVDAEKTILITLGAIKESDVQELLVQPWNMIASDGKYVDPETRETLGHPRSTGTFPRVLGHYVRELRLLSMEEAIRKMTSLPADFLKLSDRGQIQPGFAADVVIFDPKTICDTSTWTKPNSMAVGVRDVMVNGKFVLRNAKLTETASGRFVKRN